MFLARRLCYVGAVDTCQPETPAMRTTLVAAWLTLAGLSCAPGAAAAQVTFHVRDRVATDEVAELTTLYIDGQMIRSFSLDEHDRDTTITVTVPADGAHEYGLCGHIVIREPDGTTRTQAIDVTGTLGEVADRDFEAVASDDFTRFYLVDTTPDRPPVQITPRHAHACAPATS